MIQSAPRLHYKDLIAELTRKELYVRYKHLAFGYIWSITSPLASVLLYYVVFQKILKVPQPNYVLFLVVGLYPWQWIANSIGIAPVTFVSNAQLIKKTLFPRFLIPFVMVTQDAIHFLLTFPIIILMMLYAQLTPSLVWIWGVPLLFAAQFMMVYALNLLIATLTLFFRDIERIVQILMTFAFYLTPILYSESMIPAEYHYLLPFNPLATLMINWRHLFLDGTIDSFYLICSLGWGLGLLIICQWIYKKLSWRFAEIL
jgi:lipopolysaccharide transport system permease protein